MRVVRHPLELIIIGYLIAVVVLVLEIRNHRPIGFPVVALNFTIRRSGFGYDIEMPVCKPGAAGSGYPRRKGISPFIVSLPDIEHRGIDNALCLHAAVSIGGFCDKELYGGEFIPMRIADKCKQLAWQGAFGNNPFQHDMILVNNRIQRVLQIANPECLGTCPVVIGELQCETVFLTALEGCDSGRRIDKLVLIGVVTNILHIRNITGISVLCGSLILIIRIDELDAMTFPGRILNKGCDITISVIEHRPTDNSLQLRIIILAYRLQVAEEQRLVLVRHCSGHNRETTEV